MDFTSAHDRKIDQAHDHASHALNAHATTNGRVLALEKKVRELERLLDLKEIFAKPDAETLKRISKLETRAGKHLSHLKAHRSRIDLLEGARKPAPTSSIPLKIRVPTSTLAKAAARPVIQTRPVLNAEELFKKADANLTGSAYFDVESLIKKGKLADAQKFVDDHQHQGRENDLLERVEQLRNLHPDHRKLLIRGIKDGHHEIAEPLLRKLESQPGSGVRKGSR